MDFSYDRRTEELRAELLTFMDEHVYPAEHHIEVDSPEAEFSWDRPPIMQEIKEEARRRGLWNLFLPHSAAGAGLSNLQYAPLAEISGRSPHIAPEAMNCAAPDTGNMELLDMFATPEQRERWLQPLLNGEIRSAYSMTEPDVASSDASNIRTSIQRDGDGYVINGRKWWTTGILSSDCKLVVVLGLSDTRATRCSSSHERRPVWRSSAGSLSWATGTRPTAGTRKSSSTTSRWAPRRFSARKAADSHSAKRASDQGASTTACA